MVVDYAVILALVLAGEWLVPRLPVSHLTTNSLLTALGVAYIFLALYRDGFCYRQIGLRISGFLPSLAVFLLPALVMLAPLLLYKLRLGTLAVPGELLLWEAAGYLAWAFSQQLAAVGIFWRHLADLVGLTPNTPLLSRQNLTVSLTTALIFSLVHAPNPGLMVLTFIAEAVWLTPFLRHRNLFALALVHAFAATIVGEVLAPLPGLPHLKVGMGYFTP